MAGSDPQKPVGRRDDPREVRIFLRVFLGFFGGMFLAVVAVVMLWSLTESRPTPDGSVFVITRRPPRDRLRCDPLMNDEEMKTRFVADGESRLRCVLELVRDGLSFAEIVRDYPPVAARVLEPQLVHRLFGGIGAECRGQEE